MRKKIALLLLIFLVTFVFTAFSACTTLGKSSNERPVDPNSDPRYELIFYDDFYIYNTNVWKSSTGVRRGGYWHEDQVFVEDGNLVVRTQYKEDGEFGPAYYTGCVDTDALLNIPFGRYEIRFKTQRAKGYWNAIWIMQNGMGNQGNGARDGAEVDLLEIPYLDMYQHKLHIDGYKDNNGMSVNKSDIADTWHLLVMEWTPDKMVFYMDDQLSWEVTDPYWITQVNDGSFIISCEINGKVIEGKPDPTKSEWLWCGNIQDNGKDFVNDFLIDYVKVYRINEDAELS